MIVEIFEEWGFFTLFEKPAIVQYRGHDRGPGSKNDSKNIYDHEKTLAATLSPQRTERANSPSASPALVKPELKPELRSQS